MFAVISQLSASRGKRGNHLDNGTVRVDPGEEIGRISWLALRIISGACRAKDHFLKEKAFLPRGMQRICARKKGLTTYR
jgi:hypothetical protein